MSWAGLHYLFGGVADALQGRWVRDQNTARLLRRTGVLQPGILNRLWDGPF